MIYSAQIYELWTALQAASLEYSRAANAESYYRYEPSRQLERAWNEFRDALLSQEAPRD